MLNCQTCGAEVIHRVASSGNTPQPCQLQRFDAPACWSLERQAGEHPEARCAALGSNEESAAEAVLRLRILRSPTTTGSSAACPDHEGPGD